MAVLIKPTIYEKTNTVFPTTNPNHSLVRVIKINVYAA